MPQPRRSTDLLRPLTIATLVLGWLAGCSLITEGSLSDKPAEGEGGSGASGGTTSGTGGETTGGGGSGGETTGGGGSGGATGGAGGAGGGECSVPSDCPGPDNTCTPKTCDNNSCGVTFADEGTVCTEGGGEVCDGAGVCVKLTGTGCINPTECQSGICVDGVCCDGVCDLECQSCAGADTGQADGTCANVLAATDPESECTDGACDGGGACKLDAGSSCNGGGECLSAICSDSVCCDAVCGGACESCLGAETGGLNGTCNPVSAGTSDADCTSPAVCDGAGVCASCTYAGENVYGNGAQDLEGNGVATDSADAIVLTGRYKDALNVGDVSDLPATGKHNALLAKYDSAGGYLWSHSINNGTQDLYGAALAIDATDSVIMTGRYKGDLDLGLGVLTPSLPGRFGVFTAKYDSDGNVVWNRGVGNDAQDMTPEDVAVDGNGHVFITGRYKDVTDFYDGHTVPAFGAKWAVYLAKYDSSAGTTLWSQGFGNAAQDQLPGGVAASSTGNVAVVGSYKGTVDFGGGNIANQGAGNGIFVAAYDGNGNHQWSAGFSNTAGDQLAENVAIDAAGNVIVVGSVLGTISVGGSALSAPTARHVLVAKYDSAGNHLWSHAYGDAVNASTARAVSVDPSGNVLVAGRFQGTVNFGGTPLTSLGSTQDAFVLKLSADGVHICSFGYGNGSQITYAEGIAADTHGDLRLVGQYRDAVDFGSGSATASMGAKFDLYLLRYQH